MKTVRIVQIKPLPKRSRLPALKKAPLKKLLSKDDTRIVTPKSVAGGSVASEEARKRDHRSFSQMYKGKPDILKRYETSVRTKTLDTPRLKIKPRKGKAREVRLLRSESMIREAVLARRLLTDKTHQARSYHTLYARTRAALRGSLTARNLKQFEALPTPAKLADQSLKKIDKAIIELARYVMVLVSHKVESKPPNYPDACTDEEGHGFGGDMTPSTGSTPNPVGLLQNNWWPLKWYTTCVRDQGGRGACTAFGIVAAVESAVAAKHQRWINLSEQDLYMHQKLHWFPFPTDWYGDGYNAVYSVLLQMLTGLYTFPYERDWDYNKSLSRDENDDDREYTNSCSGYAGEACSDTNHQAAIECYQVDTTVVEEVVSESCEWVESAASGLPVVGGLVSDLIGEWVCESVTELVETVKKVQVCVYDTQIAGSSGFRISGAIPIWDPLSLFDADVSVAKAFLDIKNPVIFCFDVASSFSSTTAATSPSMQTKRSQVAATVRFLPAM